MRECAVNNEIVCGTSLQLFNAFQRSRNQLEQLCVDADAECLSPTRVLWKFPGGIERELHRVYLEDLQRIVFGKLSRLLDAFLEYSEVIERSSFSLVYMIRYIDWFKTVLYKR